MARRGRRNYGYLFSWERSRNKWRTSKNPKRLAIREMLFAGLIVCHRLQELFVLLAFFRVNLDVIPSARHRLSSWIQLRPSVGAVRSRRCEPFGRITIVGRRPAVKKKNEPRIARRRAAHRLTASATMLGMEDRQMTTTSELEWTQARGHHLGSKDICHD